MKKFDDIDDAEVIEPEEIEEAELAKEADDKNFGCDASSLALRWNAYYNG